MKTIEEIKLQLDDIEKRLEHLNDQDYFDPLIKNSIDSLKTSRDALKWVLNEPV